MAEGFSFPSDAYWLMMTIDAPSRRFRSYRFLLPILSIVLPLPLAAQDLPDTTVVRTKEVIVTAPRSARDSVWLSPIQGTYIFSGKKSEVVHLDEEDAALTEKYGRQLFSRIPGVFVYDMDGTGNQVNISMRGLDPHRGWELNIRKDGVPTNSDMYGYPASHYNIPMEAVERIEIVRGTGSLEYGAQFGGMLNYVSRVPDTTRAVSFRSVNTIGSFGLLSTFDAIGGKIGGVRYNAWINGKTSEGYRKNSRSDYDAQNVTLEFDPADELGIRAEWTRSNYTVQLPGPLTDSMFHADPRAATRSRSYYNPDINIPSLSADWRPADGTRLHLTASAVLGSRNSVMFDRPANIRDTIMTATGDYNARQVDVDNFNSYTIELRGLQSYPLFGDTSVVTAGVQYMINDLHRRQLGTGTTGSDFDLTLTKPGWTRDLHFKTDNIALFLENRLGLLKDLSVNAGARVEIGKTDMTGDITYYPDGELETRIEHRFPLFGLGAQYNPIPEIEIYAGWSQAYRPVIFKDIIPASIYERTDKNLADADGYNLEAGFRGGWGFLTWDLGVFHLRYDNRLGTLAGTDTAGNLSLFRTNIGDSRTEGVELFLQADFTLAGSVGLSLHTATSYMDAHYRNATVRSGEVNVNIDGNRVESVPEWISRNGITLNYHDISLSILYSYTSESFADPLNTTAPSASGAVGLVPAYGLLDISSTIRLDERFQIRLNVANVLDEHYFTKRPQFYPGPGIWPSDGRSVSGTFMITI